MRQIVVNPADRPSQIDPGPAAMLQWLRIDDLAIDDDYQRELRRANWTAIRKIAGSFKWSRFSPVFVAPIEGGKYAIIDGQHRTHAAAMCGFAEVPCQIVPMTTSEQAASFAAVNGLVTKVTPGQIYKAALAAEEQWAIDCRDVCTAADCRLMFSSASSDQKKAGQIFGLGMVKAYVHAGKGEIVTFALSALRRSEGGAEPSIWSNEILKPLLSAVVDRPGLMERQADLASFLDDFDIYAAIDGAEETAKKKRRLGFVGVSRFEFAAAAIGEALDERFGVA